MQNAPLDGRVNVRWSVIVPSPVHEWEQDRREPSEPARVLLFAIANAPSELEKALDVGRRSRKRSI